MSELFSPVCTYKLLFGEGAVERIFDNILRWDPDLRRFSVAVIRKDPKEDKYARLDELPVESSLRPPLSLPMPHVHASSDLPAGFAFFNHRNAPEAAHFIHSLHHPIHGAAHFYTYAVLVRFAPAYEQNKPAHKQQRMFSRAPHHRSFCLLAASGNQLAAYDAATAHEYLKLCRHAYNLTWDGTRATSVDALLPYLAMPRGTLDVPLPGNIYLQEPDIESSSWMAQIEEAGISLAANPSRRFDRNDFNLLQNDVFRMYLDWLNAGIEYKVGPGGCLTHRFGRNSAYMQNRFVRLRDWMNHAIVGEPSRTPPGWSAPIADQSVFPLADDLYSEEPPPDETADVPEAYELDAEPAYFPNWLQRIVHEWTFHVRAYFQINAGPGTHDAIEAEVDHLLVEQGLLKAILTEVGDIECAAVVQLATKQPMK